MTRNRAKGEGEVIAGDYIRIWHDTVAFGVEPFYARVVKVNRVKVRVKAENGDVKDVRKEWAESKLVAPDDWHPEIAL